MHPKHRIGREREMDLPFEFDDKKPGRNTAIQYFYRDASNYKQYCEIVIRGVMSADQAAAIASKLDGDDGFIPGMVGLVDLQSMLGEWSDDDHVFHDICSITRTDAEASLGDGLSVDALVAAFAAAPEGWNAEGYEKELRGNDDEPESDTAPGR